MMPTKIAAWLLSILSFFAVWNMKGQPNKIPETRSYVGEVPDQYGVWPAEEFEKGEAPWWLSVRLVEWGIALKEAFGEKTRMNSLLILHKGKLVHEAYYGPQNSGLPADSPHHVQSITKGVLAATTDIGTGRTATRTIWALRPLSCRRPARRGRSTTIPASEPMSLPAP